MSRVKLKRLLAQRRLASLLQELASRLGSPLCVQDMQGRPVLGATAGAGARHVIEVEGEAVGAVHGDHNAALLAHLLAVLATLDLEKRTLAHDTLCRYNELTLLYDMAARGPALHEADAMAELVRVARSVIPCDHAGVQLCWRGEASRLAHAEPDRALVETVFSEAAGIHGAVLRHGRAEIVNELQADPRAAGVVTLQAMLCAPLRCTGEVFGLVHLGSCVPRQYSTEQLSLLATLAFQAAAVLENRRLRQRQEGARQALQSLQALTHSLEQALEPVAEEGGRT